jgi:hypothetical protein
MKGERSVFEKVIDKTKKGVEMFLEIFKNIISVGNIIIINGPKDVEGFPISVTIEKEDLKL